jgi:predicted nucleotidyltransferase
MKNILNKKKLAEIAKKYNINTIYLFGSQATGKKNALSDYDLAVILDKKVNLKQYSRYKLNIISELLRLVNTEHIDLVILNDENIPLLLKYNAIKEGKVMLDRNKSQRADLEFNILRRWLDWQYFEKMWGEIYVSSIAKGKFI